MFESAEISHDIDKAEAEKYYPDMRAALLDAQFDQEEQSARFKAREETGYKRYKITDKDWRNREKWDEYSTAVCDMVNLTSTSASPWTLVEANNNYFARVKVLKTICKRIKQKLK